MDITEVAQRTGLPASTLRFYEKTGLITATSSPGERRRFKPSVLDRLTLIALGQAGGLSLDEIKAMLPDEGKPRVDRQVLLDKADQIDLTIKQLQAMSQGLRHAAECPEPNHAQCPTFQRLLNAAAKRLKQGKVALRHQANAKSLSPAIPKLSPGSRRTGRE